MTFTFTTVAGADLYSVQVSANPTDPNSYQQVAQFQNPSKTAGRSVSPTANIAGRFAGRTLLAWRVGRATAATRLRRSVDTCSATRCRSRRSKRMPIWQGEPGTGRDPRPVPGALCPIDRPPDCKGECE